VGSRTGLDGIYSKTWTPQPCNPKPVALPALLRSRGIAVAIVSTSFFASRNGACLGSWAAHLLSCFCPSKI
jgi:hypothetical protein